MLFTVLGWFFFGGFWFFFFLPKGCIWRWNDQVHWRVFDVVRNAASDDWNDRSGALTNFPILSENCIWFWDSRMHWRVFDFWRKQVADKQTDKTMRRQVRRCLLTAKAGKLIREKMMRNDNSIVTLLWDVLNRLSTKQLIVTFLWDVPEALKKKINENEIVNKTFDRDVFMKRANWVEKKKK